MLVCSRVQAKRYRPDSGATIERWLLTRPSAMVSPLKHVLTEPWYIDGSRTELASVKTLDKYYQSSSVVAV